MSRLVAILRALSRPLSSWYFVAPTAVAGGLLIGALLFVYSFPGKPQIGVIDLPFFVITDDTAFIVSEYLNYARRDDSIKGVVIKMSTPGGGAASSERLYLETRRLQEEKPVVLVMNGMVASGGYMMAMGANHIYAQSSSLVGNVGVIALAGSLIPRPPPEVIVTTGPYKLSGASRKDWMALVDDLKASFAGLVIRERGDRLRISEGELTEGRLYSGIEAVRMGLADELGGDTDAIRKAAELAGVSNYGLVDVNAEVLREYILRSRRIFASYPDGATFGATDPLAPLFAPPQTGAGPGGAEPGAGDDVARLQQLRRLMLDSVDADPENALPDFPLEIQRPNIYYLYTGNNDY